METAFSARTLVTVHPSALLRVPDHDAKARAFEEFVGDLRLLKGA